MTAFASLSEARELLRKASGLIELARRKADLNFAEREEIRAGTSEPDKVDELVGKCLKALDLATEKIAKTDTRLAGLQFACPSGLVVNSNPEMGINP